jgi:transposase
MPMAVKRATPWCCRVWKTPRRLCRNDALVHCRRQIEQLDGQLLVVTNTDAPAKEVIRRYKSLAHIEHGFRTLKSDIEIGLMVHRLPRRSRAHALVCFLALILHRVLRMRLKNAQRGESPGRLHEQLRRIQQQAAATPDGQLVRGVTKLATEQKQVFAAIGVLTPEAQEFV